MRCPICDSVYVENQHDCDLLECWSCGSEFTEDGEITLDSREV